MHNGIPTIKEVRSTFRQVTGLTLQIMASLSVAEFTSDVLAVSEKMNQDFPRVHTALLEKQKIDRLAADGIFQYQPQHKLISDEDTFIECIYLYTESFYPLHFYCIGKIKISFQYLRSQIYFPLALEKTFRLLSGKELDDQVELNSYRKKQLLRLKKWDDYYWFNRPGR